jgi:hypothetical protein
MSLESMFSKKNMNLLVGLITILVVMWLVMFVAPSLFVYLFDTFLGNLILIMFIALAAMYNVKLAVGLAAVFIILFRFAYMSVSRMSFII